MFASMTALTSDRSPAMGPPPVQVWQRCAALDTPGSRTRPAARPPPSAAYSAGVVSEVSAILLDAGGVLVFPEPANLLPPLRQAGADPDLTTLERAHYHAMAAQDRQATPPAPATWWRDYLTSYVAACGVAEGRCEQLAIEIAGHPRRYGWAHAGHGVKDGLRALAGLGLPMGV